MADGEWVSATVTLLVAVMSLVIFKNVLIPQLKGLFEELKPAVTELVSGLKETAKRRKGEGEAEE